MPWPMELRLELPSPPHFELETVEDRSDATGGFLRRLSRVLRVVLDATERSAEFVYDEVDRRAIDAVVVVPHFLAPLPGTAAGMLQRWVVLRSAVRPPVVLRDARRSPHPEPANRALWEVPAGLVEPGEQTPQGLRDAARRELLEETGFAAEPHELQVLGPASFPAPGVIAERHFFFHVRVDLNQQSEPELDGSPLEAVGELVAVPLTVALRAAARGQLADAKTELALRRLADALDAGSETHS